jgi:hypothetical protein
MSGKAWDKYRSYGGRKVGVKELKQRFLIVCEGGQTEPNYFRGFRVPADVVVDIEPGAGMHTSVVQRAIDIVEEFEGVHDQVWCVFDRDKNGHNSQSFIAALELAEAHGISVAYSNDAFEIWYLLHFNYHDTAIHRHDYVTKLRALITGGYQKNDPKMFEKLEDKMEVAIRNAKNLLAQYEPTSPERDDPSTTVHLLVEQLQRYI